MIWQSRWTENKGWQAWWACGMRNEQSEPGRSVALLKASWAPRHPLQRRVTGRSAQSPPLLGSLNLRHPERRRVPRTTAREWWVKAARCWGTQSTATQAPHPLSHVSLLWTPTSRDNLSVCPCAPKDTSKHVHSAVVSFCAKSSSRARAQSHPPTAWARTSTPRMSQENLASIPTDGGARSRTETSWKPFPMIHTGLLISLLDTQLLGIIIHSFI